MSDKLNNYPGDSHSLCVRDADELETWNRITATFGSDSLDDGCESPENEGFTVDEFRYELSRDDWNRISY